MRRTRVCNSKPWRRADSFRPSMPNPKGSPPPFRWWGERIPPPIFFSSCREGVSPPGRVTFLVKEKLPKVDLEPQVLRTPLFWSRFISASHQQSYLANWYTYQVPANSRAAPAGLLNMGLQAGQLLHLFGSGVPWCGGTEIEVSTEQELFCLLNQVCCGFRSLTCVVFPRSPLRSALAGWRRGYFFPAETSAPIAPHCISATSISVPPHHESAGLQRAQKLLHRRPSVLRPTGGVRKSAPRWVGDLCCRR